MTVIAAAPKCDANSTGRAATDWGHDALPCQTRVGLRSFTDRTGTTRYYCAATDHQRTVERRFGRAMFEGMDDDWDARKSRIDQAILADPERPS